MPPTTGHGADRDPPGVAYVYAPDRKAERPIAHLEGFKGVLQVDGYAGYRKLAERGDVRLAFCWSHVRRGFYELATPGPSPIASEALEHIAALYAIEKDIRGRSAEERRAVRQQKSRPLVDALEPWLRAKLGLISQKSKLAEAIRYALSRWEGLTRFIDDGRIELDNNLVRTAAARPLRSVSHYALPRQVSVNIGSMSSSATRHGRPFRASAALTLSLAKSVGTDLEVARPAHLFRRAACRS